MALAVGKRKRELIYDAASEAVNRARVEIRARHYGHIPAVDAILKDIDGLLFKAERNAGAWAVRASDVDARGVRSVHEIIPRTNR